MTFFGFPKVKWLQYTGKVGKCRSYQCNIFSGYNIPKLIKVLTELLAKIKRGGAFFCGHNVVSVFRTKTLYSIN